MGSATWFSSGRARVAESARTDKPVPVGAPQNDVAGEPPGEIVLRGTISEILPEGILLTDVSRRLQGQGALVPFRWCRRAAPVLHPTAPHHDRARASGIMAAAIMPEHMLPDGPQLSDPPAGAYLQLWS